MGTSRESEEETRQDRPDQAVSEREVRGTHRRDPEIEVGLGNGCTRSCRSSMPEVERAVESESRAPSRVKVVPASRSRESESYPPSKTEAVPVVVSRKVG